MSKQKTVLFGIMVLAGVFGLMEAAAALIYYLRLPVSERETVEIAIGLKASEANLVVRYTPHPYFNFVSNPSYRFPNGYQPHNAQGLRGPSCCPKEKDPRAIRIVAVGGSTTYGMYFTFERHVWPALLEETLRQRLGPDIQVINAGVPNHTSYELIGLTAMLVSEWSPDIVIFHMGLNDAFTAGYHDEGGPDNTSFRHAWSHTPLHGWLKQGMRISYMIRLLGRSWASQDQFSLGDMAGAIQFAVPSDDEVLRNAQTATGKYFRRNLTTLIALCRTMGATPLFLNEPINPSYESGQGVYYSAVVNAVIRNNRISKELAEQNGFTYVDLYSRMRDPSTFVDAAHENNAGMQMKALYVAEAIAPLVTNILKDKTNK